MTLCMVKLKYWYTLCDILKVFAWNSRMCFKFQVEPSCRSDSCAMDKPDLRRLWSRETYTWSYTVPINQPVDTEHLEARKAANSPRSQTTCYEKMLLIQIKSSEYTYWFVCIDDLEIHICLQACAFNYTAIVLSLYASTDPLFYALHLPDTKSILKYVYDQC